MDIELIGKTQKGKNKIRQHGKFAKITRDESKVFFSPDRARWIFIEPHNRWLKMENDADFIVKKI